MFKPELLAPAGDLEKLKIAFQYGADAVYAGVPEFGMRVKEIGFNLDSLAEGIKYTHEIGKKIYVTVNIFAKNDDIEKLPEFLAKLVALKPDALIVADPGVLGVIEDLGIDIPLHLSTQANVTSWRAVRWWVDKVKLERVILARELHWTEIKQMHEKLPEIELECFIHGALCMSYSGRCNISNYLTNRDANQGDCSQCCRWSYDVYVEEKTRPGELMKIEENERGSQFFNSRELCLLGMLPEVIDTGVVSLKIEGRNKSIYYLARVVGVYRRALDDFCTDPKLYQKKLPEYLIEISSLSNRGYTTGFFGADGANMVNLDYERSKISQEFVGLVTGRVGDLLEVVARNQIKAKNKHEMITPNGVERLVIEDFLDKNGESLGETVNTNTVFYLKAPTQYPENSMIRQLSDS